MMRASESEFKLLLYGFSSLLTNSELDTETRIGKEEGNLHLRRDLRRNLLFSAAKAAFRQ